MASLLPNGKQTFLDQNGAPLAGGTVTFYVPGTTTLKDTYQDAAATILNTNPVILDASGQATVYGGGSYRQVVKDQFGNVVWDQPTADTALSSTSWAGTSSGIPNAQIVTAPNFSSQDGQTIDFIAGYTNTGTLSLNPNKLGQINVKRDSVTTGPANCVGGEVVAGNVYRATYDGTAGCFHLAYIMDKSYVDARDSVTLASAATDATTKSGAAQTAAQNFATSADVTVLTTARGYADTVSGAAKTDAQTFATNADIAVKTEAHNYADTVSGTAKTDAQTFATNADITVLTTAATTAQTKADAAKTAAITAAASDALTKYVTSVRLLDAGNISNSTRVAGTVMWNTAGASQNAMKYLQFLINGSWVTAADA